MDYGFYLVKVVEKKYWCKRMISKEVLVYFLFNIVSFSFIFVPNIFNCYFYRQVNFISKIELQMYYLKIITNMTIQNKKIARS